MFCSHNCIALDHSATAPPSILPLLLEWDAVPHEVEVLGSLLPDPEGPPAPLEVVADVEEDDVAEMFPVQRFLMQYFTEKFNLMEGS